MSNLLQETIDILKEHGKSEGDVLWVGRIGENEVYDYYDSQEVRCPTVKNTWGWFRLKANFEYDNGYGGAEIPPSLVVVGADFWLERHEYDGSEWWEYKIMPKEPERVENFALCKDKEGFYI